MIGVQPVQVQTPDIKELEIEEKAIPGIQLSLKELATILIQKYNYNEGLFDLSIEFQIGIGGVGPDPNSQIPGAMIGVSKIGLLSTMVVGPTTVDAAVVNPAKIAKKVSATQ